MSLDSVPCITHSLLPLIAAYLIGHLISLTLLSLNISYLIDHLITLTLLPLKAVYLIDHLISLALPPLSAAYLIVYFLSLSLLLRNVFQRCNWIVLQENILRSRATHTQLPGSPAGADGFRRNYK